MSRSAPRPRCPRPSDAPAAARTGPAGAGGFRQVREKRGPRRPELQLETLRDAPTEAARLQTWGSRGGAGPSQAERPGCAQRNSRLSDRALPRRPGPYCSPHGQREGTRRPPARAHTGPHPWRSPRPSLRASAPNLNGPRRARRGRRLAGLKRALQGRRVRCILGVVVGALGRQAVARVCTASTRGWAAHAPGARLACGGLAAPEGGSLERALCVPSGLASG